MTHSLRKLILILLLGGVSGFLNGLLGAGGGIVIVYGLHVLFEKKVANGRRFFTTALAVMLPLSLFSVYLYHTRAPLPFTLFDGMLISALVGGAGGAWLLGKLPTGILNRIFATVVALSGVFLLF